MAGDEGARVDPSASVFPIARPDKWRCEFAHLEMKVRPITTVSRSDRGDLFAALHFLFSLNQDRFDVAVIRLHELPRAVLFVGVQDDYDVAPAGTGFVRENHLPVGDGKNRIAEVAVLAADSVQVVAEMAILREWLRIVSERAVLVPDREIEARRGR